jgi:hypothetical protein
METCKHPPVKFGTVILALATASCATGPQASSHAPGVRGTVNRAPMSIEQFCIANQGRKVGTGECWSLANESLKAAGKRRPGRDLRVWGRLVDSKTERIEAGDIIEFESARFSDGITTGVHHTAVVIEGGSAEMFTVAEQKFGGMKKVTFRKMDLRTRLSGKVLIYRPAG